MSETNGNGTAPEVNRILSLEAARSAKQRKGNDFITVQQAYDMVIQECAKVHEFYLEQIPHFTARMIQDALLSYGLIKPIEGADIAPVVSPKSPETPSGDTSTADTIPPAEPAA